MGPGPKPGKSVKTRFSDLNFNHPATSCHIMTHCKIHCTAYSYTYKVYRYTNRL